MDIHLSSVIKRELKVKGDSLNNVSKKTKIPLSTLHGWANGTLPNAKNLHLIKRLSDYLGLTVAALLFNVKHEGSEAEVLFSSTFVDDQKRYRLTIEKLNK